MEGQMESETENGICSISSISSTISCAPVSGQRECYRHNRTISLASSCDEGSLMVGRVMLSQARKRNTQKYDPLFRSCDHHGSFMVQTLKHPRYSYWCWTENLLLIIYSVNGALETISHSIELFFYQLPGNRFTFIIVVFWCHCGFITHSSINVYWLVLF